MSGPGPPEPLTVVETAALLALACAAVRAAAAGSPLPDPPAELPSRLLQPAGVFVSLHAPGLRGCVGSLHAETSLALLTTRMAAAAAIRDPRFPPLRTEELGGLEIEISILSNAWQVAVEDIDPSLHGVVLELAAHRAVLLPQVAARYGWSRDTLLAELCEKAGLAREAWRDPAAVLQAFTVTIVTGPI